MSDDLTERLKRVLDEENLCDDTERPIDTDDLAARLAEAVMEWHGAEMVRSHNEAAAAFERSWLSARSRAEKAEGQLAGAEEQNRSLQELLDEASKRAERAERELGEATKLLRQFDSWVLCQRKAMPVEATREFLRRQP